MIQRILLLSLLAGTLPALAQITVNSFTFPTATKGASYGPHQLTASVGLVSWSVSAGTLPFGLTSARIPLSSTSPAESRQPVAGSR